MGKTPQQLEIIGKLRSIGRKKAMEKGKPKPERSKAQIGRGSRAKGAQAEREALGVIREALTPVYARFGITPDAIKRNLDQVTDGGCDLKGLAWLSIEIKRREVISLGAWWDQTLRQTKPGEIPFLMWRCSRQPWRVRVRAPVKVGPICHALDLDMEWPVAQAWLEAQLTARILADQRGTAAEWGLTDNT